MISDWIDDLLGRPRARERILRTLSADEWQRGIDVWKSAKVGIARFYILALQMENEGLIESQWEPGFAPAVRGGHRRRLYRLRESA